MMSHITVGWLMSKVPLMLAVKPKPPPQAASVGTPGQLADAPKPPEQSTPIQAMPPPRLLPLMKWAMVRETLPRLRFQYRPNSIGPQSVLVCAHGSADVVHKLTDCTTSAVLISLL